MGVCKLRWEGVKEREGGRWEGVKEEGCEVVRSLHVPGRCLFLPVSVREELGEGGREEGREDGRMEREF